MKRISRLRPSPAMAVALTALVISMGGTAVAASHLISGDKLIKKGTLSGNRLRSHTLTGAQINLSRLGVVPAAAQAAQASNATNAAHATVADTANALPALSWVPLTLTNGWIDTFGPNDSRTPAMAIDAQGVVHLRGVIRNDGTAPPDQFAIAPAQFRPSQVVSLSTNLKFSNPCVIDISPSGTMTVTDPSGSGFEFAFTNLDGLTYAAG
jgi:hypothetical protein